MGKKPTSAIHTYDLPEINAVLAKEDTVQLIPGPNGTVKIVHIKRKIIKTVQNECVPPICSTCTEKEECIESAGNGRLIECTFFGKMQDYVQNCAGE